MSVKRQVNFKYIFPATLRQTESKMLSVSFRDMPELSITVRDLAEARSKLNAFIVKRIQTGDKIPKASSIRVHDVGIALSITIAGKAALYEAFSAAEITKLELADRLKLDEKEVRRLLDPHYASKIDRIQTALDALGRTLSLFSLPSNRPE